MKPSDLTALDAAIKSGNPAAITAAVKGDFGNAMVAATPGGIEMQEAAGQAAFVGTLGILPKDSPREQLEKLGFKFGEDADDLFINVIFPKGWSKKATDHSMWSDLLDERGRKRGGIFYKAAFYDRAAHMQLDCRYSTGVEYLNNDLSKFNWSSPKRPSKQRAVVTDHATDQNLWESAAWTDGDWTAAERPQKEAAMWLAEHFPDYRNPCAYW